MHRFLNLTSPKSEGRREDESPKEANDHQSENEPLSPRNVSRIEVEWDERDTKMAREMEELHEIDDSDEDNNEGRDIDGDENEKSEQLGTKRNRSAMSDATGAVHCKPTFRCCSETRFSSCHPSSNTGIKSPVRWFVGTQWNFRF